MFVPSHPPLPCGAGTICLTLWYSFETNEALPQVLAKKNDAHGSPSEHSTGPTSILLVWLSDLIHTASEHASVLRELFMFRLE